MALGLYILSPSSEANRVPLLDSKLVRLRYAWYYRIKSPSTPSSALAALRTPQPFFWTLNAVEPRLTYPNLLASERSERDTLRSVQSRIEIIVYMYVRMSHLPFATLITRKVGGAEF